MKYTALTFANADEAVQAYDSGRCKVLTSDVSQLHAERLKLKRPDDHVILPDVISKEPLGPAVRFGDDQWLNIVKWTHFAMVNAEELGVGSATIDAGDEFGEAGRAPPGRRRRRVWRASGAQQGLGREHRPAGRQLRRGLRAQCRDRRRGSAIPRGMNSLWTKGGIQYAPPIR